MKTKSKATEDDKYIGEMIQKKRIKANMSQQALAAECDMSYQQIQKYEKGINRVSAITLCKIGDALGYYSNDFLPKKYQYRY